ncbi:hypothetical protein [Nocardia sp. CS682]|uniref:hypothetical protein n=1 Tax=Nocardia sp. CS682 TaxID=1047172 RepID=UPI00143097A2|nr:hypothetical protein [Nocardia sp. CS682]
MSRPSDQANRRSRTMAADPDTVLNTAAAPARAGAWLPITQSAGDAAEHYEIRLSANVN